MTAERKTYIFKPTADSMGPIAVGSGESLRDAMRDAAKSIRGRRGVAGDQLADLLEQGRAHQLRVPESRFADFREHGFSTRETALIAEVITSHGDMATLAGNFTGGAEALLADLQSRYKREAMRMGLQLSMIDWLEVLEQLELPSHMRAELEGGASQSQGFDGLQENGSESPPIAARVIPPEVIEILSRCYVEGANLYLPKMRLDRALYAKVDDVLRALGGKWVGRKIQAHVFEEDPAPLLDIAVSTGTFVKPQDFGYFPTPAALVERAIALADLRPGMKALEPQAGQGAIAIRMAQILGIDNVTVVELLHSNARKLVEAGFSAVNRVDFLTLDPVPIYDRIIMNPPFNRLADVDHIMHATKFLKPDGRLVAFSSPSWTFNSASKAAQFRDFVGECEGVVEEVDSGAFKESGTNIATRLICMDAENFPWYRDVAVQRERARA